jgi:catechol 2,3-dioxygenase-like lactoylglutathione lyase family enzyme
MTPVPVSKVACYEVRTQDVDRLVEYYEDALALALVERAGSTAYLTTGPDHHCVVVAEGEPDGRARLGFEVSGTLDAAAEALAAAGIEAERRSDPEPGIADALVLPEPDSGTPLWLFEGQAGSGVAGVVSTRPTKLGHIAAYVPDLPRIQGFYQDVLGFRWSDTIGDFFAFLRCNADHHSINLMESDKRSGLFHVAYEMRDVVHLKDALDHLAPRGYRLEWGPGRHGAGHNIFTYHRDPDGNLTELFTEIDLIFDEETGHFEPRPWHETWPQGPKVWELDPSAANKWGPINPEMMVH